MYKHRKPGCVLSYKVTNLKAIHNWMNVRNRSQADVYYPTKLQIWKQFTTHQVHIQAAIAMCIILQSYKFESNSQPQGHQPHPLQRCVLSYKVTNLKAIHNSFVTDDMIDPDVYYPTKLQIWKQFTTSPCQDRHRPPDVYYPTKLQIWKQFTTPGQGGENQELMCIILQSYKFESNSQPTTFGCIFTTRCVLSYKVTNLKAIHNW